VSPSRPRRRQRSVLALVAVAAVAVGAGIGASRLSDQQGFTHEQGVVRHVHPGQSIARVVAASAPGDTVVVHRGSYPRQAMPAAKAEPRVNIVRAPGEAAPTVAGLQFSSGTGGVNIDGLKLQADPRSSSSPQVVEFRRGAQRVRISNSRILGGSFAIKAAGASTYTSDTWAHDVDIVDNEIAYSYVDTVQLDGAVNFTFEHNRIHDPNYAGGQHADGIQSIASRNLVIHRNRFYSTSVHANGPNQGVILGHADPRGAYRTVEDSVVTDNLVYRWPGVGLSFAGTKRTKVANNIAMDSGSGNDCAVGFFTKSSDPTYFRNYDVTFANNVVDRMCVDLADQRPFDVDVNNAVGTGGAGANLVTGNIDAMLDKSLEYRPLAGSPLVDSANTLYAPRGDIDGVRPLDDRGAFER
jgi:Right handed beta helix region